MAVGEELWPTCSCLMRGCIATPVAQTQAPKAMSLVSFVCELTTLTLLALTDATRLFSTRSMPSLAQRSVHQAQRQKQRWPWHGLPQRRPKDIHRQIFAALQ